jgi:succinate dehydrogenase/fumarate reductase flavoprotein subunit
MPQQVGNAKTDVLVVGAGMGGMTVAIEARDRGARVTLIEKFPDVTRSSTSLAGGAFQVHVEPYGKYSREELVDAIRKTSGGLCDLNLVKTFVERIADDFTWLKDDLGLPLTPNAVLGKGGFITVGKGAGIPPFLEGKVKERGADVLFNAKAKRLLTDKGGRVIGLEALTPQGPRDFHAGAVVLATGGFESNGEMVRKYLGQEVHETAFLHRAASISHAGDGQLMAIEVGASFAKHPFLIHCRPEDKAWEKPGVRPNNRGGPIRALPHIYRWGLWINKRGMRFIDESEESDPVSTCIMRQPEGVAALVFDRAIREKFPEEADKYEQAVPGVFIQADTVGELAEKIGFPKAQVERTVREFNQAVVDGKAVGLEIPKGAHMPTAVLLEKPPFYAAYPVWVSMNTIWGGLEIDSQARVLDRDGKPIPGLYAAGAMFGGIFNGFWTETPSGTWTYRGNYHWLAASLQVCLVFGRVAGEQAAAYAKCAR